MKTKEIQEMKNRPAAELSRLIKEGSEKLRGLKFDLAAGKVKNVSELRKIKRSIARMHTFIKEQSSVKQS
jgi:ribosomal protein L29